MSEIESSLTQLVTDEEGSKPTLTLMSSIGGLKVIKPQEAEHLTAFIYGESGVGKTTLAASIDDVVDASPTLLVDFEKGLLSIRRKYPRIDAINVETYDQAIKVYRDLKKLADKGQLPYKTIILDPINELEASSMDDVLIRTGIEAENNSKRKSDKDPDQPEQGDFGKNRIRILRLLRNFKTLPVNLIAVSTSKTEKIEGKIAQTKPNLAGQLSGDGAAMFNEIFYIYKADVTATNKTTGEKKTHNTIIIRTEASRTILAKDRTTDLPPLIYQPTFTKIFKLMEEGNK